MDGQAVVEVRKLADEVRPVITVEGRDYVRAGYSKYVAPRIQTPIEVPTLDGMIRMARVQNKYPRTMRIMSPTEVAIYEFDPENQEEIVVAGCTLKLTEFRYDKYMPIDEFRINLLTKFVPSKDREALIRYISKITEKSETRLEDDGVTINTTIEVGTSGANMELQAFSSELNLRPRRTFPDVDQPETKLLFRMKNKNEMALFDFSDGTWINEACESLHALLSEAITSIPIV